MKIFSILGYAVAKVVIYWYLKNKHYIIHRLYVIKHVNQFGNALKHHNKHMMGFNCQFFKKCKQPRTFRSRVTIGIFFMSEKSIDITIFNVDSIHFRQNHHCKVKNNNIVNKKIWFNWLVFNQNTAKESNKKAQTNSKNK